MHSFQQVIIHNYVEHKFVSIETSVELDIIFPQFDTGVYILDIGHKSIGYCYCLNLN